MLTGDLFQPLTEKKKKPKPTNPDKWAYAKSEAKKKFDVYPSAYANAWAAKKYKELGGGWRMGEDIDEAEGEQSASASERSINDQVYVNLMRKAQELPVTGLNRDERIKLALAKSVNKALDNTKKLQQATDNLERELDDVENQQDSDTATKDANVQQAPAAQSEIQKTINNVTNKVNQEIEKIKDPKQKQELKSEADKIKQLARTSQLSNKDVEKINKEVKSKEKNGFTAQELKRVVDTVAQQAKQTKQEKTAQQQTQVVQKSVDPDVKKQIDTLNTVVADVVQPQLGKLNQDLQDLDSESEYYDDKIKELQGQMKNVVKRLIPTQPVANDPQARQAAESIDQIDERKKKKSKSKKAFGGYYYPGYGYYGQGTAETGDGGGDGGGGESMFEVVIKNRTPEETGSLDSYYSRRRKPHKVVDGKRVELTDKEEIQQYMDAYENETDRKDYGDLSEQRLYFRTVATLAESLEHNFGMQKDDKGWYLTARSGRQRILDAERAFGTPQIKQ